MIDLVFETMIRTPMIVLWFMNLFGAVGHGWSTRSLRAPQSKSSASVSLDGGAIKNCCPVNLVVHRAKVFDYFEVLHEPTFGANFAIFDVLCACIQSFAF